MTGVQPGPPREPQGATAGTYAQPPQPLGSAGGETLGFPQEGRGGGAGGMAVSEWLHGFPVRGDVPAAQWEGCALDC